MFDSLAIAAMADEIGPFVGGRVQRIAQSDRLSIGLELYHRGIRKWLVVTADPLRSGLWLQEDDVGQASASTSPLLLLLRKWVRGARLLSLEQPPFERVLRLAFACPSGDDKRTHNEQSTSDAQRAEGAVGRRLDLIVEATGRLANLILVDEQDVVLEAIKRVPASINRHRTILPRKPYVGPPPQNKATPLEIDASLLRDVLQGGSAAAGALVSAVRGISPLAAREAVFRASERLDAPAAEVDADRLATELSSLVGPLRRESGWAPSVGVDEEGYVAFAPYPLTHFERWEPVATLSDAVRLCVGARATKSRVGQAQDRLADEVGRVLERERRRLESLERELASSGAAERLRESGELLLAYATQIPSGADVAELHGARIELDSSFSAVENAQRYFERYTRAREAARQLPDMVAAARARVDYLGEALVHAELAESVDGTNALRAELATAGYLDAQPKAAKASTAASTPLRVNVGRHSVFVGRSARQNDEVTFRIAGPEDLWLHARGVAGAHVVLRTDGGKPDESAVVRAAELAAYHSASRAAGAVPVDVTERRHVRKIKGGAPGAVTYSGERTISVAPTPYQGREAP